MLISLSLSKPSNKRHAEPIQKKKLPRMGSERFLQLSRAKQKLYIQQYPNSRNRFLLKHKRPVSKDSHVQTKGPVKVKQSGQAKAPSVFTRKISRQSYDKLGKRDQKVYDKRYPDVDRKFVGKKHILVKKINPILAAKREASINRVPTSPKLEKLKAAELAIVNKTRDEAHQDFKHAINPESVKACKELTTKDVQAASTNMQKEKAAVLASFEDKLENDRLDAKDITPDEKREAVNKNAKNEDPEIEDIAKKSKHTRAEKKKVEDLLDEDEEDDTAAAKEDKKKPKNGKKKDKKSKKRPNFFVRDMEAVGKIFNGEKVEKGGRSNLIVAMSILGRYAMIAGGVALVSMGAAPLALHIAKEIYDNWDTFQGAASNDDDEDLHPDEAYRKNVDRVYDAYTDYLFHLDVDELHNTVGKTKFVSTSSETRSKISYRSVPEERDVPIAARTRWNVFLGKQHVGEIYADEDDSDARQSVRIWRAYVITGFNPMEFPHADSIDPKIKEPFVLTNDKPEVEHNLELHSPTLMTLPEARSWVCSIIERN